MAMTRRAMQVSIGIAVVCVSIALFAFARYGRRKGGGELHAKLAVLEREVSGLRASVAKLDRRASRSSPRTPSSSRSAKE